MTHFPPSYVHSVDPSNVELNYHLRFLNSLALMRQSLEALENSLNSGYPLDADTFIIQRNIDLLERSIITSETIHKTRAKELHAATLRE